MKYNNVFRFISFLPFFILLCACDNNEIYKLKKTNDCLNKDLHTLSLCNTELAKKIKFLQEELLKIKSSNDSLDKNLAYIKKENEILKKENIILKNENLVLKETDQSYFNKAIDIFKTSKLISDFQNAENAFDIMMEKFPLSAYKKNAEAYKQKIQKKIKHLNEIEAFNLKYNSLVNEKDWNEALKTLESAKGILTDNEYQKHKEYIESEKNKPIETTINKLVADVASSTKEIFSNNNKYSNYRSGNVNVKLVGYTIYDHYVKRDRESIRIRNSVTSGEYIEIFYSKLDQANKNFFINNDFTCKYNEGWEIEVIGNVRLYSDSDDPYIVIKKYTIKKKALKW